MLVRYENLYVFFSLVKTKRQKKKKNKISVLHIYTRYSCVCILVCAFRAWYYCKACHEEIRDETLIKKCKCKNCEYTNARTYIYILWTFAIVSFLYSYSCTTYIRVHANHTIINNVVSGNISLFMHCPIRSVRMYWPAYASDRILFLIVFPYCLVKNIFLTFFFLKKNPRFFSFWFSFVSMFVIQPTYSATRRLVHYAPERYILRCRYVHVRSHVTSIINVFGIRKTKNKNYIHVWPVCTQT